MEGDRGDGPGIVADALHCQKCGMSWAVTDVDGRRQSSRWHPRGYSRVQSIRTKAWAYRRAPGALVEECLPVFAFDLKKKISVKPGSLSPCSDYTMQQTFALQRQSAEEGDSSATKKKETRPKWEQIYQS